MGRVSPVLGSDVGLVEVLPKLVFVCRVELCAFERDAIDSPSNYASLAYKSDRALVASEFVTDVYRVDI